MDKMKRVLILGSGMMVEPLVDILLSNKQNILTVATNDLKALALLLKKKNNSSLYGEELDATKHPEKLETFVKKHDVVISYLPPVLHPLIAGVCLKHKRHMVTTSYVNPEIKKLTAQVEASDLVFMNEIGLDPGIDHLLTYKVIHEAEKAGDKIIAYESWCGALCSPEYLDNPLLYKFSWSPRGALLALRNEAHQLIDGKVVKLPMETVLVNVNRQEFHPCFNFEGYYNRDSLHYKESYNLKDAETVIRGTIRFKGFSFVFQCFKNLTFFSDDKIKIGLSTWRDLIVDLLKNKEQDITTLKSKYKFSPEEKTLNSDLALLALSKFDDEYILQNGFNSLYQKILSCLDFLKLDDKDYKLNGDTILDAFAAMMEDKIKLKEWERDLVFMSNEFVLKTKLGKYIKQKYNLVVFGGHNNLPYSAVSLLVSLPCAVTTQLILDGKIKERGVLTPKSDVIINAVLEKLEKERIYVTKEEVKMQPKF